MHFKIDKFSQLPVELKIETAQDLSNRDLNNLAQTSKNQFALFQPLIDDRKPIHFLHHLTRGQHDVVEAMLNQDISLIFKRSKVRDCSGREFEHTSGFEYVLWALDKPMWTVMLACIPSNEEGKKVLAQLIAQYNKVNTDGVTYRLNGQAITEKHFDFENTIIKELQTQADSTFAPGFINWVAIDKQWREGVGAAEILLPMHAVVQCFSDEPFSSVSEFTSQPKSSKQFYNSATNKDENWFSADSKLSVDYAIFKGKGRARACVSLATEVSATEADDFMDAMKAFWDLRTSDFIELKSQLEEQMGLDNHRQVP